MEIIIAKTAGFCFGVQRAVNLAYEQEGKNDVYTYGPIIHNAQVVQSLENKGIRQIVNIDEIQDKSTLIIRSHGVSPNIYKAAENNNINIVDATCPYVKKIHRIVARHRANGDTIVIVGNKDHPEVEGIMGWANNECIVIADVSELNHSILSKEKGVCVVCQTTYRKNKFNAIIEWINNNYKKVKVYDTICSATSTRQEEALEIAKSVDYMIVIGGKNSSNTQKLYEICKNNCSNTVCIETAKELELNNLKDNDRIGITAGASTPDGIIKEVIFKMQQFDNNESFAQLYAEHEEVRLRKGQIVTGKVIGITENKEVIIDLGHKYDGIISKSEISADLNANVDDIVKLDDEIEVYVLNINDAESTVVLSKKRVDAAHGWKHIEEAYENKTILTGTISTVTKGGAIVTMHGTNIFIPVSLLASRYVDNLKEYKDKEIDFQIIEIDARRRRVIGNRKALLMEKLEVQKEEALKVLEVGKRVVGSVKNITGYGVFVDLNGIDGFVHISNLSWKHIKSPKEVVKMGQEVEVKVTEIDTENKKVSLTMKFSENNPWVDADAKYPVDSVLECKVVRIVPFGAFLEIEEGLEALLHISQISLDHISKVEEVLSIGETIQVKVLEVDTQAKRINVSRKALLTEADGESDNEPKL